ncbi:hypothetical protein AX15_006074 [Amanita polypyramis BW_CC]|nr:hypothetical protein AX15_006074 [Amanita polypyramis BW_CC]
MVNTLFVVRSRQTRSSKGRTLLSDPAESTQALNQQLATLGLYAVQTLGDGNCLFRALSDQYHGTDIKHAQVRQEVCDWIAMHKSRYAPFVDDERGIEIHLRCMRENGTYGGHMELSAFAHLTRRNIKVVQPGLVYVIEWNAGGDPDDFQQDNDIVNDSPADPRERRKQRRERIREKKQQASARADNGQDTPLSHCIMYVAYHDWEHFSSIRNLRGPHVGLPYVEEVLGAEFADVIPPPSKRAQKVKRVKLKLGPHSIPASNHTPKVPSSSSSSSTKLSTTSALASTSKVASSSQEPDPLSLPLPNSRTPSPTPSLSALSSLSPSPAPYPPLYAQPEVTSALRATKSPKRNFDESSSPGEAEDGDEYGSEAGTKRARLGSGTGAREKDEMDVDDNPSEGDEDDGEESHPRAHPPDSSLSISSEISSLSSATSSSSSSPSPPPPSCHKQGKVSEQVRRMRSRVEKPLMKSQKKAMGLIDRKNRKSAGVIVIPPGKRQSGGVVPVDDAQESKGEWLKNGSGRLDVRGFRELRI